MQLKPGCLKSTVGRVACLIYFSAKVVKSKLLDAISNTRNFQFQNSFEFQDKRFFSSCALFVSQKALNDAVLAV